MESSEKACPFCAETIKAAAVFCRHCGKDLAVKASRPKRHWLWITPLALLVGFLALGAMRANSPEGQARSSDRRAIELCWEQHEAKSLAPGEKRVVAAACERMEADYQRKHGTTP